jgi:hypothetical protein
LQYQAVQQGMVVKVEVKQKLDLGKRNLGALIKISGKGDATVVRFRSREDKKPKHADELA